jgi:hypothetical protein
VVTITFPHSAGHFSSSSRQIIELENYKKAKILKKYAKLCAEEGIESERVNLPGKERKGEASDIKVRKGKEKGSGKKGQATAGSEEEEEEDGEDGEMRRTKKRPLDSLQKAQKAFQKNKASSEQSQQEEGTSRGAKDREHKDKGKGVGKKPRRVHAETKKGQPVMRAQITRMLESLQAGDK